MTIIFNVDELKKEKQLHPDWVFFVGDKEKNPQKFVGSWKEQTSQTTQELEELIEGSQKRTDKAWNWGIRTGIKNIACLDFDWEFLYYRWRRTFGDRAKTVTYRTANKGFRVLFRTRETENDNPYKNSLHTEFENAGYAVIGGYAEDIEGKKQAYYKIKSYTLYNNKSFSFPNQNATDNTIIADTKKWLAEQQERYDFLQYKCVNQKNIVDRKHITLTHDQRLAILNFMLQKGFDDEEIHDFFSTVYDSKGRDYDKNITQTQIESGRKYKEKNGKPHPCKPKQHENGHVSIPLYQTFNASPEHCKGCLRKRHTTETATTEVDMEYALHHLNSKFTVKCPTDTRELYAYENGVYALCDWKIAEELEKLFGQELKTHFVEETLNHLERANYITRDKINNSTTKIPLQNGTLNLNTLTLEPFDPEQVFTYKLNVEYDSTKDCPKFRKFVNQIQPEENDRKLLQEIMGYCLLPDMPFHKIFWFYGVGRNGKGRIILTLEYILGKENCSELSLSDFRESRRFSLCHLYGKLLNVSSEPNPKYPLETNNIKLCTGEDTIYAELKGKNRRLRFTNKAKLIVLGNRFPKVDDISVGFWDRVEVLNFPASFVGEDSIPHIERIWLDDPDEVSGTMNWMLEGLYRLLQNKKFSSSKTTEETKQEFMKISDAFNAWISECCKFQPEACLTRQEAYDHYKNYAYEIGAEPDSTREFYAKMRQTPRIKDTHKRIDGKFDRIFQGIVLKPESDADVAGDAGSTTQETVQENNKKSVLVQKPATSASPASKDDFVEHYFPEGQYPICFLCHKPVSELQCLTNIDGKPVHRSCVRKIEAQEKKEGNTQH